MLITVIAASNLSLYILVTWTTHSITYYLGILITFLE